MSQLQGRKNLEAVVLSGNGTLPVAAWDCDPATRTLIATSPKSFSHTLSYADALPSTEVSNLDGTFTSPLSGPLELEVFDASGALLLKEKVRG